MLNLERLALELLEYKVEDLRQKRASRGAAVDPWDLYRHLAAESASLAPADRARLDKAGRALRRYGAPHGAAKAERRPAAFDDLTLGDLPDMPDLGTGAGAVAAPTPTPVAVDVALDPAEREEQEALHRLAKRVWWEDVDGFVYRVAASLRAERERASARLLFATVRNLARHAKSTQASDDLELRGFRVLEPIPGMDDPLLSLNDVDSLAELVREVVEAVMQIGRREGDYRGLELPAGAALGYVRRVATAVARDPYAGEISLHKPRGPSSAQLKVALQELAKERLPDDQRRQQRQELEQRLQQTLAYERNLRAMYQQDVLRFGELVDAFFDRLVGYLPREVGGEASDPRLQGGVLFAENPALRLREVPPGATSLTVHLKGPVRFKLAGVDVAVAGSPPALSLFVAGQEAPLRPQQAVQVGPRRLQAFHEGRYLHLRIEEEDRSLATQVAEALAIHLVLRSEHREPLLTMLKLAANTVVGEAQDVVRRAIARVAEVTATAPDRRVAVERYLEGSARAVGASLPEALLARLTRFVHRAITIGPTELDAVLGELPGAVAEVYQLTGEPLSIGLGGVSVTVRQYRGRDPNSRESLVAMLPGKTLGSFTDSLIEELPNGTLICVRGDQELAAIFAPAAAARSVG